MSLCAQDVSWRAGGRLVVDGVSLTAEPGSTVGLLGPNGSGKSSLLRLLSGIRATTSGVVTLDGALLTDLGRRDTARRVAVVEQHATTEADLSVADVVELGRIPHRRGWAGPTASDAGVVREALERVDMADRARQSWQTLSGGERQRAQIARALAQEPRELLLDEPTNHLDIRNQLDLLELVVQLPVTTVMALHDLNLASMYCDTLVVLAAGRAVAAGPPEEVITESLIAEVYGVRSSIDPNGPRGRPAVRFLPGPPEG
ncbi:ABC transporter ATP-binding protein [Halostreptopolyspora alba]|uniref:ABC transporter ATP-binding protein n=1 Tax=Halostreptopolyspora alba TaxID=2487137 RepID=A0A3N0EBT0_9ACTN|nr:ABC transporter ATP-binding protein [Nocardiopsaceae bacterium YIM 96095]